MTVALRTLVEDAFAAFEAKDLSAALQYFADDAVMIDPHYPTPHMDGKRAISEGLQWAFSSLDLHNRKNFYNRRWPKCRCRNSDRPYAAGR